MVDGKIKTIYVTEAIRKFFLNGQLVMVVADNAYKVIPGGVGAKIEERMPDFSHPPNPGRCC